LGFDSGTRRPLGSAAFLEPGGYGVLSLSLGASSYVLFSLRGLEGKWLGCGGCILWGLCMTGDGGWCVLMCFGFLGGVREGGKVLYDLQGSGSEREGGGLAWCW